MESIMKILWLDDERDPHDPSSRSRRPTYDKDNDEVVWIKSYDEFVAHIEQNGLPDKIYFDHDLGEGKTGYDATKWLVQYCMDHKKELPIYYIHSMNPVGAKNIKDYLVFAQNLFELRHNDDNPDW